jgi:hypothetical protein
VIALVECEVSVINKGDTAWENSLKGGVLEEALRKMVCNSRGWLHKKITGTRQGVDRKKETEKPLGIHSVKACGTRDQQGGDR